MRTRLGPIINTFRPSTPANLRLMPAFSSRRNFVAGVFGGLLAAGPVFSQQRRPVDPPLLAGFESTLVDCGLAAAWQRQFAGSTGLAFKSLHGPGNALLHALEAGDLDVAVTGTPSLEEELVTAGLSHDRRPVARSRRVLV